MYGIHQVNDNKAHIIAIGYFKGGSHLLVYLDGQIEMVVPQIEIGEVDQDYEYVFKIG